MYIGTVGTWKSQPEQQLNPTSTYPLFITFITVRAALQRTSVILETSQITYLDTMHTFIVAFARPPCAEVLKH